MKRKYVIERRACDYQADCDCRDFDGYVEFEYFNDRPTAAARLKELKENDSESSFRIVINRGF